jgi:hypothetical protein
VVELGHLANKIGQLFHLLHGKGHAVALGQFGQFFWGRDVFISYSHSGAEQYARSLARLFMEQQFYPFFAGAESKPPGQMLEHWLGRALRRSTILVLIAEPLAFKSQWVAWELKTFLEIKRDAKVIAISIGTALQDIDLSGTPFLTLPDRLFLTEDTEALHRGQPSVQTINQIRSSLYEIARIDRRRRIFYLTIAAVLLAFLAGLLVGKNLP